MLNHVSKGGHFLGLFIKIAVFGANGGICKWVVKYALERGCVKIHGTPSFLHEKID